MKVFWFLCIACTLAGVGNPCAAQPSGTEAAGALADPQSLDNCSWDEIKRGKITKVLSAQEIELDGKQKVHLINLYIGYGDSHKQRRKSMVKALRQWVGREAVLHVYGSKIDLYQRQRAHVSVDGYWLQGEMIKKGFAQVIGLPDTSHCLKPLLALERTARLAQQGLWAGGAHAPIASPQTDKLLGLRGQFALVFGKVKSAKQTRTNFYINFGTDWSQDFTVLIPRKIMNKQRGIAKTLVGLKGTCLQVRGWVQNWRGPMIKLDSLFLLEKCT